MLFKPWHYWLAFVLLIVFVLLCVIVWLLGGYTSGVWFGSGSSSAETNSVCKPLVFNATIASPVSLTAGQTLTMDLGLGNVGSFTSGDTVPPIFFPLARTTTFSQMTVTLLTNAVSSLVGTATLTVQLYVADPGKLEWSAAPSGPTVTFTTTNLVSLSAQSSFGQDTMNVFTGHVGQNIRVYATLTNTSVTGMVVPVTSIGVTLMER